MKRFDRVTAVNVGKNRNQTLTRVENITIRDGHVTAGRRIAVGRDSLAATPDGREMIPGEKVGPGQSWVGVEVESNVRGVKGRSSHGGYCDDCDLEFFD